MKNVIALVPAFALINSAVRCAITILVESRNPRRVRRGLNGVDGEMRLLPVFCPFQDLGESFHAIDFAQQFMPAVGVVLDCFIR
jgi:hypothetical protein